MNHRRSAAVTALADRAMARAAITERAAAWHASLPRTLPQAARVLAAIRYRRADTAALPAALSSLTADARSAGAAAGDDRSALASRLGHVVLTAYIAAALAGIDLDAAARHAAARAMTAAAGHPPAA